MHFISPAASPRNYARHKPHNSLFKNIELLTIQSIYGSTLRNNSWTDNDREGGKAGLGKGRVRALAQVAACRCGPAPCYVD